MLIAMIDDGILTPLYDAESLAYTPDFVSGNTAACHICQAYHPDIFMCYYQRMDEHWNDRRDVFHIFVNDDYNSLHIISPGRVDAPFVFERKEASNTIPQ